MRSSLFLSVATALLSSSLLLQTEAQQLCNGYAGLCAKTYDKVTYPGTHNSYAYTPPGGLATNQDNNIPIQLNDGIRVLSLDAYNSNKTGDIELCHTSCQLLDAGTLTTALGQIKTFLDANPNEVVTILWENAANLTPAQFQTVYTAAGMTPYLYTQTPGNTAWPTLASMISSGKRLVNFVDAGADASVPWLMAEYDFVFETPWNVLKGQPYPCTVDRPKDQRKQMYVLNHFIYESLGGKEIAQPGAAPQTNGDDLVNHANTCQSTFSQTPSFVLVDFYEIGVLFQTVAQLNGVTWNGKLPTQPKTKGSGGASILEGANLKAVAMVALTATLGLLTL
ncbi:PLC-like phosphodiesterase [Mortierella sp. GBAus27b]|nr:hypothetical protein BGX31_001039 [Mortierella sp. GBA43]KAI8358256.1 PLC-like phosphodiesterase [Mortierella sp. GBAus27b]